MKKTLNWIKAVILNVRKLDKKEKIAFYSLILVIVLIIAGIITGIILLAMPKEKTGAGNIQNGGKVLAQNDELFFVSSDDLKIYKNDTSRIKISDVDYCSNLISEKDILYFIGGVETKKQGIYSFDLKTSKLSFIYQGAIEKFFIYENWIYFDSPRVEGGQLTKMLTDGTKIQKLTNAQTEDFAVSDGWVYFANSEKNGELYKVRTDGTEEQLIVADFLPEKITAYKGNIYFIDKSTRHILKMDATGKNRLQLTLSQCETFNIYKDKVYYTDMSQNNAIYSVSVKGGLKKLISEDTAKNIHINNGTLYYFNSSGMMTSLKI